MSSLPTAWYCPECGRYTWPLSPSDWNPKAPVIHMAGNPPYVNGNCEAHPVEVPLIPPGTPPEQILNLVGDVRPVGRGLDDGIWHELDARWAGAPDGRVVIPREET